MMELALGTGSTLILVCDALKPNGSAAASADEEEVPTNGVCTKVWIGFLKTQKRVLKKFKTISEQSTVQVSRM